MSRRGRGFSLPVQLVLWLLAISAAGAVIGAAVGLFQEGGIEAPVILLSVLFANVVGLTVIVTSFVLFARARALGPVAGSGLLVLALLAGSIVGSVSVMYAFPLFVMRDLRQAVAVVAIASITALIVGGVVYAYEGLRIKLADSLREVEEVRLVEAELKTQAARAELSALQARINPHFFFNTLNTISSLLEDDPEAADEVLQTLADLFRYTLKSTERSVSLEEELRFVERYLSIERARFGARLTVEWDVDPASRKLPVPGLILQPLVENAVVHGVSSRPDGGTIRVTTRVDDDTLDIGVLDDGPGPGRGADTFAAGHGLGNVRRRLHALHGDRASVDLTRADGDVWTTARLRLPLAVGAAVAAGAGE